MSDELLLPERARLFHIGPPKTASTAVQQRAAAHRAEMLDLGVRYPGKDTTQRAPIAAFIGRSIGWIGGASSGDNVPSMRSWDAMMQEIEADTTRRILFGHEYAAGAGAQMAARLVEAIGPRVHVVITLRDFGSMIPSVWQEYNKAGNVDTFGNWLDRVIAMPRTPAANQGFFLRHDHGALVRRWAAAAGAENVSVVVLDRHDHQFVYNAFERMLGLPLGLLDSGERSYVGNRGMSAPEIELVRRLNLIARDHDVQWPDYQRLIANGAALRMLEMRTPPADEERLELPEWAAEVISADANRYADEIAASGVRVIGDLESLRTPPRVGAKEPTAHENITMVPMDAAVEALAGLLSSATSRGWSFGEPHTVASALQRMRELTARQLARELVSRARNRVRRRR